MKILGAGLSRTGTTSLAAALTRLGYRTLHWQPERLRDVFMQGATPATWRRYDDYDAVTDLPAALFWRELLGAYPDARCVLTVRDEDGWFDSVRWLFDEHIPRKFSGTLLEEAKRTQAFAYGGRRMHPLLARKRFRDHNALVRSAVPGLLVLDVERGDGWPELCGFLGCPVPDERFPHANRRPGP
jgi:hypothetical protein